MLKMFFISWLVLKELVDIVLGYINLKFSTSKDRRIPTQLESIITKDRFELSLAYLKDRTLFGIGSGIFELLLTLLILLTIAPRLEVCVKYITSSSIKQGLLFFGIIFLINFVLTLPFSLHENFRIEAKYGFNKITYKLFFIDSIKSLLITCLLGGLFLTGILTILKNNTIWWWQLSLTSCLFLIVAMWLFPVILLPLFNKFKPLEEGELKEAIVDFTSSHKISIKKIFVMDASTRTSHGNAFLTGMGFSRRLVLFDTILNYPKEEILSIIAHEWGHHKHHDIYKQLFTSIITFIAILFLSNQLFISGFLQQSFSIEAPYSLLYASFIMISPILFYLSPITNYLIRKEEYSADLFSLLMTRDLDPAVNSLKRLIRDNLSNLNPHPIYRIFNYSHPAPEERIQFLLQKAKENNIS